MRTQRLGRRALVVVLLAILGGTMGVWASSPSPDENLPAAPLASTAGQTAMFGTSGLSVVLNEGGDQVMRPAQTGLSLSKTAPENLAHNSLFTYTLTVGNDTGSTATNVLITDVIPSNVTFAYALDGGVRSGNVVSWTLSPLAPLATATVRFAVTATMSRTLIVNGNYAVSAAEWPTPTMGVPTATTVDYVPIYAIQGAGPTSPDNGYVVKTVGVVVGLFEGNLPGGGGYNGFYLQDPTGDANIVTSNGLFVNLGTSSVTVTVGELVTVTGWVQEFNEYNDPCPPCETQIRVNTPGEIQRGGTGVAPLTLLDPPGDPNEAADYFESLEGMLVTLPVTGVVVGPTNDGTIAVVRGNLGINRVVRGGVHEGRPAGVRHYRRYGDMDSGSIPNLIVGSVVTGTNGPLVGPLAYTYGNYALTTQAGAQWQAIYTQTAPSTVPTWPAPGSSEFSLATFNTYNFDSIGGETKATKVVSAITQMNGPTFVALEEIAAGQVMSDLLARLSANGYNYDYAYSYADTGGHGVALLWRADHITGTVTWTTYQTCSANGSTSSDYDPLWSNCRDSDQYPLFARRPVVVTGTVKLSSGNQRVVVIANQFEAKGTAADKQRRLEEAQFVNTLVHNVALGGSPYVFVLGDLNDFENSPPLQALYANDALVNTWYTLPPEERYSAVYNGVSQVLDHILVTPAAHPWLLDVSPLHIDTDFPHNPYHDDATVVWRASDRDPVVATFGQPDLSTSSKTASPSGQVRPGSLITYTIVLSNGGGTDATTRITDVLNSYYAVYNAMGLTHSPTGTLTWTGVVTPGQSVTLQFVARVADDLLRFKLGQNMLTNTVKINDGAHVPFDVITPPSSLWVEIYGVYLPLVTRH